MKKFLTYAMLCALLASTCAMTATAANPEATAAKGTPVVDGVVDEIWGTTETYTANALKAGTEENITTEWKALWDDDKVYFLVEVSGDTAHFFNGHPSWGDGCELYFDALNDKPTEYNLDSVAQFGWDAQNLDDISYTGSEGAQANMKGKYEIKAVEKADGYIYEVAVDLDAFCGDLVMAEGTVIGLEIQVNSKCDEAEARTSAYGWADTDNTGWQNPSVFGNLTFVAAPVVETVEEIATAPQTFDAGLLAVASLLTAAAGLAISKKR